MFEFDGIKNSKVERQDGFSGQVTRYFMTPEEMKEKWGERVELTEERYNELKAENYLDKDIAAQYGIQPPILSQKKKQWREKRWAREDAEDKEPAEVSPVDEQEVEGTDETTEASGDDTAYMPLSREDLSRSVEEWKERALKAENEHNNTKEAAKELLQERDEWQRKYGEAESLLVDLGWQFGDPDSPTWKDKYENAKFERDTARQNIEYWIGQAQKMGDELDQYKAAATESTRIFNHSGDLLKGAEQSRDYWQGRAEKAEAELADLDEVASKPLEAVAATVEPVQAESHASQLALMLHEAYKQG